VDSFARPEKFVRSSPLFASGFTQPSFTVKGSSPVAGTQVAGSYIFSNSIQSLQATDLRIWAWWSLAKNLKKASQMNTQRFSPIGQAWLQTNIFFGPYMEHKRGLIVMHK
jgi:hypothetical protein